jgi:hypothetical protein
MSLRAAAPVASSSAPSIGTSARDENVSGEQRGVMECDLPMMWWVACASQHGPPLDTCSAGI